MMLKVIDIKDQEDGSAIITVDMDKELTHFLIEYGLVSVLREAAEDTLSEAEYMEDPELQVDPDWY